MRTDCLVPVVVVLSAGRQSNGPPAVAGENSTASSRTVHFCDAHYRREEAAMENRFNPRYHQQRSSNAQDSWVAVAGGTAIAAGSLMPFVTVTSPGATMSPAQKGASVFFA
jgi:hypothetical protein